MGTDKRARQKANRAAKRAEREAEQKTETRNRMTRRVGFWAVIAAVIIVIFVGFSVLGGGDESSDVITITPTPAPVTDEEAAAPAEPELASEIPADFEPFAGTGALAAVDPAARNGAYDSPPELTIDTAASYAAILDTDVGTIRLELFPDEAPLAVNNFVNLARDGFYDGTTFHRVMEDFMAQAGDPTGTGTGGPGYSFEDEVDTGRVFDRRGLLAMANAGPDTNGSQFFITYEATDWLDGLHTIFGELVGDDSALDEIVLTGEGEPTVINSVRIIEG